MSSGIEPSDVELLDAWRRGRRAAGEQLFERYFDRLFRFFWNKVDDDQTAEDLVQETLLACVEGRDRLRDDTSFVAYAFRVARNRLASYWDQRKAGTLAPSVHSVVDAGASPSKIIAGQDDKRLLLTALRTIALDDQVLLELFYWEELTSPEIAAALGIPAGTVRGRLRNARIELEKRLRRLAARPDGTLATTASQLDDWVRAIREYLVHDRAQG